MSKSNFNGNSLCFVLFSLQGKFSVIPSVFVTAAHYRAGLKCDAASVWIEDVTQSSFKVCLRELQNYAGSHDDVYTVSVVVVLLSSRFRLPVYGCFLLSRPSILYI